MKSIARLFIMGLVSIIAASAVIFVINNYETSVELQFAIWKAKPLPLPLVIVLSFFLGVFVTMIFVLGEVIRLRARLRRMRKSKETLEKEVDALRNQPLLEEPPTPIRRDTRNTRSVTYDGQSEESERSTEVDKEEDSEYSHSV